MRILLFITLLLSSTFLGRAQEIELDTALRNNEYLYEFYMPYFGSEYDVDMNYQYKLEEMAQWILKDTTLHLHIRGHVCCGDGDRLSRLRAHRVYRFLLDKGAPAERMSYKGYSNRCPKNWPEKTEEDENMNRRVDFVIRKLR
ncbi:MAG: OmpA family protein [bacterium]|nr:OmpA family protein [bacterium]